MLFGYFSSLEPILFIGRDIHMSISEYVQFSQIRGSNTYDKQSRQALGDSRCRAFDGLALSELKYLTVSEW